MQGRYKDTGDKTSKPGPGAYMIPTKLGETPSYSMPARGKGGKKDNTPGPGSY
jgi:hypothetical protein